MSAIHGLIASRTPGFVHPAAGFLRSAGQAIPMGPDLHPMLSPAPVATMAPTLRPTTLTQPLAVPMQSVPLTISGLPIIIPPLNPTTVPVVGDSSGFPFGKVAIGAGIAVALILGYRAFTSR